MSRLVATYFVDNPDKKPVVNHIDGNKRNNNYQNLEWATISENTKHAFDHGLAHNDRGFADSQSKPVAMYSNDGELLAVYGSIHEAARETGLSLGYIAGHIRHKPCSGTQGVLFKEYKSND